MNKPIDELKNRLRTALEDRNISQQELSELSKIPKSSISQYLSGYAKPKQDRIYAISKALNINEAWLLGYDVPVDNIKSIEDHDTNQKVKSVRIPVLGEIVAGIPIDAYQEILDFEEITPELAATGDFFALKVKGDSMSPRIAAGDVVIVRQQNDIENGDIAVVFVNGDTATLKKVLKHENGITLVAFNTAVYEPHFYTNKEVEELPISIGGKVIELRAKF